MRKIKFRGKRTDNGEWVYGDLIQNVDCVKIREQEKDVKHIAKSFEIDPETIGQFTGLKDKNGTMIWEGDIVKATVSYNNAFQDRVDVKTNIYEVKYHEKYCYFYLARKQNNLLFDGNWSYYLKEIEVIGNIHDNSELLKGGVDNEQPTLQTLLFT